ncbi:MAG: endonuclease/exonuclease/phosphatase family protein [Actinomycetota bacterium]
MLTWPVLIGVITILALRWRGGDRPITVALIGLTPLLILPLVGAAIGAWRSRSRLLRAVTAAITALFLVWMNPVSAVVGCRGDATASAITVYTANVLFDVGQPSDIASSILANDADIILLQEVRSGFVADLEADPRLDIYPHRVGGSNASGKVIWSRWPITDSTVDGFVVSQLLTATIDSPQGSIEVTNVHTLAPVSAGNVAPWQAQFGQLGQLDTSSAQILAGDFNATEDHRPFRDLLGQGWTDAHEPKGCGFDATWPTGNASPLPVPIYRLDHVLVTDHFEILDLRFADPAGSDHIPVVVELQLGHGRLESRAVEASATS